MLKKSLQTALAHIMTEPSEPYLLTTIDVSDLIGYIKSLCALILGSNDDELITSLQNPTHVERLQKFIEDPQQPVIVIQKIITADGDTVQGKHLVFFQGTPFKYFL